MIPPEKAKKMEGVISASVFQPPGGLEVTNLVTVPSDDRGLYDTCHACETTIRWFPELKKWAHSTFTEMFLGAAGARHIPHPASECKG